MGDQPGRRHNFRYSPEGHEAVDNFRPARWCSTDGHRLGIGRRRDCRSPARHEAHRDDLYILDADQVRTGGIQPLIADTQLGGILSQLVIDHTGEQVYVSDSKTRSVYVIDLMEVEDDQPDVFGHRLDTARDMTFAYGRLWVATGWLDGNRW